MTQSLHCFKMMVLEATRSLQSLIVQGFKATQSLHWCKNYVLERENHKIAYILKKIKWQNRSINSFLEKKRIGVALIDYFFLNRPHHYPQPNAKVDFILPCQGLRIWPLYCVLSATKGEGGGVRQCKQVSHHTSFSFIFFFRFKKNIVKTKSSECR